MISSIVLSIAASLWVGWPLLSKQEAPKAVKKTTKQAKPVKQLPKKQQPEKRESFCTQCGTKIKPDDKFCSQCGAKTNL